MNERICAKEAIPSLKWQDLRRVNNNIIKMRGFYLYCICEADAGQKPVSLGLKKKIKTKGIESGEKVFAIPFKNIEAVVSEVDLSQFNEKKIKDKLQEDPRWTEKNIRRHHDVIAQTYKTSTVIPMKFGIMFKTKKSLEAMLKKYYKEFKRLLAELSGKGEWGVKIYLEDEKFAEFLKKENKEIKKLEKERSAMPEGRRWYVEKKVEESIAAQFEEKMEQRLQAVVKRLEDCCEEVIICDLLPKEVTEAGKDNIFNAACLVNNNKLDVFKKLLLHLEKEYEQIGGALKVTGPWPPYNFVQTKFQGSA